MPLAPLADRFWRDVAIAGPDECWLFTGKPRAGSRLEYGLVQYAKTIGRRQSRTTAHRVAFYLHHSRWPAPGMVVRHRCDVPLCCNPAHLEEGTQAENTRDACLRGRNARKLTAEDAVAIRESSETITVLAERYGVSDSLISMVRTGQRWPHAPGQIRPPRTRRARPEAA